MHVNHILLQVCIKQIPVVEENSWLKTRTKTPVVKSRRGENILTEQR